MRRGRFHGLRLQRRIRVLPGVHLNVSLSGVGVSVGGRGFHAGVTPRGQRYVSAGLPGTGLSVRQYSPMNMCDGCGEIVSLSDNPEIDRLFPE
jgi:Protein of unknown function (DUF4236)